MLWATKKVCESISFPIKKTFAFSIVNQSRAGRENLHIIEKVETPFQIHLDIIKYRVAVTSILHLNFWYLLWLLVFERNRARCMMWYELNIWRLGTVCWSIMSNLSIVPSETHHQSDLIETPSCHRLKIRQQTLWLIKEYTQFWFQSDSTNNGCVDQITNQHQDDKDCQEAQ